MTIAIIGLGYVGIQLATAFGRSRRTIGFDLDRAKLDQYRAGVDPSGELTAQALSRASELVLTSNPGDLIGAKFMIIVVPTPVDSANKPDFGPLIKASEMVGSALRKGATVIYESTVYPGATEEVCIPILEETSGMKWKRDFHIGYSPERINPGDPEHGLAHITKIVSADDDDTLDQLAVLYGSIVEAGVHRVSSIRVAEAAKVIENTQRDLNIALVNELAMIFDRLGIDSNEVFKAAETKWNFHRFRPGLVGGHCIGVDPYYLTHKAQSIGYDSRVILAGRRINDEMAEYVAEKTMTELLNAGVTLSGAVVTVLGVAFKENCADTRNSQVFKLITALESNGIHVQVIDPLVNSVEVEQQHHIGLQSLRDIKTADGLILAVAHGVFLQNPRTLVKQLLKPTGVLIDIKSAFTSAVVSDDAQRYWSL